jgi:hypothetical protein
MRFLFTMGRLTVFDFKLFEIDVTADVDPDVIVVHHHEEDETEGPEDLFGKG